eukprot:gene42002-18337_t
MVIDVQWNNTRTQIWKVREGGRGVRAGGPWAPYGVPPPWCDAGYERDLRA